MTEPSNFDRVLHAATTIGQAPLSTLGSLGQRLEHILVDSGSMENAGDALLESRQRREMKEVLGAATSRRRSSPRRSS